MVLFLTRKSCNFIAEIFGWSGQWPGNNGYWRRGWGEKMSLCLRDLSGKAQGDNERQHPLYQISKDTIFLSVSPAVRIFLMAGSRRLPCSHG